MADFMPTRANEKVKLEKPRRGQLKVQKANATHSKKINLAIPYADYIGAEVGDYLTVEAGTFEGRKALILWKTEL